jgi:hypothetical protein
MESDPTQGGGVSTTRSVSQWERALLAQWFAGTERTGVHGVAAAYVSERSHDEPRLRNMIVIAERDKRDVAYLIHRPIGENVWTVTCGRTGGELGRFRTLPEALETVRPNRVVLEPPALPPPVQYPDRLVHASNGQ